MRDLDYQEHTDLAEELKYAFDGKYDGSKKNILVPECPFCGKGGYKFGIYVGQTSGNKVAFSWNCFSCATRGKDLLYLLKQVGMTELYPSDVTKITSNIQPLSKDFAISDGEDVAVEMKYCEMPKGYSRLYFSKYLKSRGFKFDDYEFFEVGETPKGNPKFFNYVVFPIKENNEYVGYVARHIFSKEQLDQLNKEEIEKPFNQRKYIIPRYRNSTEEEGNDFQHLIYNIDAIVEGETTTVILVEGVFDAIALTRKLNLYNQRKIAVCATFGKQITPTKMEKLQIRGVEKIILGYDGDAVSYIYEAGETLDDYFDVLIANIDDKTKDWDDLSVDEIIDIFANNLLTPVEYKFKKVKI